MNTANIKILDTEKHQTKVAILIDYPNMEIGLKQSGWSYFFNYKTIEKLANRHGEIVISRIYGDWNFLKKAYMLLSQYEVEMINVNHVMVCGEKRKDLVDTRIAVEVGILLCKHQEINLYIIVSGDADMIPIIQKIKEFKENKVIVIGEKNSLSNYLGKYADRSLFYQHIVDIY